MAPRKNKTAEPVDLADFDSMQTAQEDGVDVVIKDPRGKDLGFTIRVAGPDSDRQKDAQQSFVDQRIADQKSGPFDSDELIALSIHVLAASTIDWSPFVMDRKPLEYSYENAKRLYLRFPFIRDQIQAAAGSRARFLQPSGTSSGSASDESTEGSDLGSQSPDPSSGTGSGS